MASVLLRDCNERDATRHLDRYVREIPRRLGAMMDRACAERTQVRPETFTKTAESLVPLWEWFVQHVNMKLPSEFPPPDPWWTPEENGAKIDPDLAEWSDRIGLYVAACFKASFPERGIRWKACTDPEPKLLRQPVLSGFRRPYCPRLLVYDLALKIPQGIHAGRTLCDAFEMWADDVLPKRESAPPGE